MRIVTIKIEGVLEIDQDRGVVYFHAKETGHSALRICRLPKPIPDPSEYGVLLDVTHMFGANWSGDDWERLKKLNDELNEM